MASQAGHAKGGISRYIHAVVDHMSLLSPADEFTVILPVECETPLDWLNRENIRVVYAKGRLAAKKTIFDTFFAHRLTKSLKPDVWFGTAHTLPALARIPKVLAVYDLFALTHPDHVTAHFRRIAGAALRFSIPRAARIVTISHFTKGEIQRLFRIPDDKIIVTHLGPGNLQSPVARDSVTNEDLRRIGVPWNRFFFTISTVQPIKNLPRLLQAVDGLSEDVGLAIAGAKGWETSTTSDAYEAMKHKDRVAFLGYVDDADVPKLFARCEAAVVASVTEGFGIPLVEAMTYGAPIVSSNGGSLPEVGGDLPIYFDPYDVQAISGAIEAMLAHPQERQSRVAAGREHVRQFTWDNAAKLTLGALREAAESRH